MPWFDNGPVQRVSEETYRQVRRLGFRGCEVVQVRLDGFKSVIHVATPGDLVPEFQEGEFEGVQIGCVRVVWRALNNDKD